MKNLFFLFLISIYHFTFAQCTSCYKMEDALVQPDSVTSLSFQKKDIDLFLENADKFKNLKSLDIVLMDLDKFPMEICSFTKLQFLSLHGNKLSELPDEFKNLRDLMFLNLDLNEFSELPTVLFDLDSLKELRIGGNNLTSVEDLYKITGLKEVYLGGLNAFYIGLPDMLRNPIKSLPHTIMKCSHLERISIHGTEIESLSEEILEHCRENEISIEYGKKQLDKKTSKRIPWNYRRITKTKTEGKITMHSGIPVSQE